MSYVPADNNRIKAIARQKIIDKAIRATVITYNNKKYKIEFLTKESKMKDNPDFQYKIKNAPKELANAKIYIRLDGSMNSGTIYQYTMGVYMKSK